MKAKLYRIEIVAAFDDEQEVSLIAETVMLSLQSPGVPAGHAKVVAVPIDPKTLEPMVERRDPRYLLN